MASDTWTENLTPFEKQIGKHVHIAVANASYGYLTGSAYDFCTGFADSCALHEDASGNTKHFRSFGFDPDNSVYVRLPDARNFPNGFVMGLINSYKHTGGGWDRADQTVNHQVRLVANNVSDVGGGIISSTNILCNLEAFDGTTTQAPRRATTAFLIDNSTQAGTWWFGANEGDFLVEHGKAIPS